MMLVMPLTLSSSAAERRNESGSAATRNFTRPTIVLSSRMTSAPSRSAYFRASVSTEADGWANAAAPNKSATAVRSTRFITDRVDCTVAKVAIFGDSAPSARRKRTAGGNRRDFFAGKARRKDPTVRIKL